MPIGHPPGPSTDDSACGLRGSVHGMKLLAWAQEHNNLLKGAPDFGAFRTARSFSHVFLLDPCGCGVFFELRCVALPTAELRASDLQALSWEFSCWGSVRCLPSTSKVPQQRGPRVPKPCYLRSFQPKSPRIWDFWAVGCPGFGTGG